MAEKVKIVPRFGALSSSADPSKLSLLVKGALISLVPIISAALEYYGVPISEVDLSDVINSVFGSLGFMAMAYGGLRKVYFKWKNRKNVV